MNKGYLEAVEYSDLFWDKNIFYAKIYSIYLKLIWNEKVAFQWVIRNYL
jgi:hypothetical protein